MLKDNGSVWDDFNDTFLWGQGLGPNHPSRQAVKDWIVSKKFKSKPTFLDVACGMGVDHDVLSPYVSYSAADKTDKMVSVMKAKGVEIVKADIRELPFKDNEFDIVQARAIFEHLPDVDEVFLAMKECLRVSKKYCVFSFFLPLEEQETIAWTDNFFNNTYCKSDIETFLTDNSSKFELQHVPSMGFVDDYDIYFVSK